LGIGTINPGSVLDIRFTTNPATDNGGGDNVLRVYTTTTTADTGGGIGFGGQSALNNYSSYGQITGRKDNSTAGNYAGYIQFCTNNAAGTMSERVRITSAGNLGIGITNPSADLTILNTVAGGNGALLSIQNRSNSSGTKCGIMFGVDTSDANWSDVGNAQIIMENTSGGTTGQLKFRVFDSADSEAMKIVGNGSGNYRNGVAFARAGVALDNSWDGFPGIAVFNTDGYGNTSNRGEFRIHGFSQSYASYPGTSGSDFGTNLRIDGTTYFSSDARHKTNIVDNPYGLNEILQLQPRKFNRTNSDGQIEENQGDILGFIAQEVREVIPEAVNYYPEEDIPNENGWCRAYSLSDSYIVSTLVNAVKEQNSIIETLISRIESLESQINT